MPYEVINEFIDKSNKDHHYKKGDLYPVEGSKPSEKRIKELTTKHKKYKRVFIKEAESKADEKKSNKRPSPEK